MKLLDIESLHASGVVANNRMNRGRNCLGGNSYRKDLAFDCVEFMKARLRENGRARWLDVGCGEGRALVEAAQILKDAEKREALPADWRITGLDLAGMFREIPKDLENLRLVETAVEDFREDGEFDLVTAVHSLHYVGDKLGAICALTRRLAQAGLFRANLELQNLRLEGKPDAKRVFAAFLRKEGFVVDPRKHLIALDGPRNFEIPFEFLGADDRAGPNSTGQPVVDSYYRSAAV
ncbi:MAG: class I SAM-dependent methyltransferase [Acidobacteria bacterium]|nr:class I SAM-dependent methyltransferase [Acidobacteriota bacterium]